MILLVQQYLLNHSFRQLEAEHGVYANFSKCGAKFSLNYDLASGEKDQLANQCRGLILSPIDVNLFVNQVVVEQGKSNYLDVIPGRTFPQACPMFRFFNYNPGESQVNWKDPSLRVLQKLDGTLIIVYYDQVKKDWYVATRGVPEADIPINNGLTFRMLFEKALNDSLGLTFDQFSNKLDRDMTYCFELTSGYNRIVVNYPSTSITLLAMRNLLTLEEVDIEGVDIDIPKVKKFAFSNVKEIVEWVSEQSPLEHEGVVVLDCNYNRVKIKSSAYVMYNSMRDSLGTSSRNCMELILLGKDDDALQFLPNEIVVELKRIKYNLLLAVAKYNRLYLDLKEESDLIGYNKKAFALVIEKYNVWKTPLFMMYDNKVSDMWDFIAKSKKQGGWPNSFLDRLLEI